MHSVLCPQCGQTVQWTEQSRYRPFCSERCKLIDLGQWMNESYRVPAQEGRTADEDENNL